MHDRPSGWLPDRLTCRDVAVLTSEYLDHRLAILTNVQIGCHLACCASCRMYAAQIRFVSFALRNQPMLLPSALNRLHLRQRFAARHSN